MAELADAHGSGPCDYCSHEGSSPFSCIIEISRGYLLIFFVLIRIYSIWEKYFYISLP